MEERSRQTIFSIDRTAFLSLSLGYTTFFYIPSSLLYILNIYLSLCFFFFSFLPAFFLSLSLKREALLRNLFSYIDTSSLSIQYIVCISICCCLYCNYKFFFFLSSSSFLVELPFLFFASRSCWIDTSFYILRLFTTRRLYNPALYTKYI